MSGQKISGNKYQKEQKRCDENKGFGAAGSGKDRNDWWRLEEGKRVAEKLNVK